ncbi:hypothetical protein [Burkholderia diffusa]|uniref:hypothetical protein n=1 Tax=Burkholderia diffusa TaxID=488732 RepID=UPI0020C5DC9B|nr:hypothetical protein [Burkholderia diffusa]
MQAGRHRIDLVGERLPVPANALRAEYDSGTLAVALHGFGQQGRHRQFAQRGTRVALDVGKPTDRQRRITAGPGCSSLNLHTCLQCFTGATLATIGARVSLDKFLECIIVSSLEDVKTGGLPASK